MRSKLGFLLITIVLLFSGCVYDYDAGLEYKLQVVINSVINPDNTINARIFWTREVGSPEGYNPVENFSAKIYEMSGSDKQIVFEGDNLKDSIITTYYPIEGARYRLEVDVPEYGIVSAETSIPLSPTIDMKYNIDSSSWTHSYHFEINKISSDSGVRSIIVRIWSLYENYAPAVLRYICANNAFCDQFNAYVDSYHGDGTYHRYGIRIPYKNLNLAVPLELFVEDFSTGLEGTILGYDDWGFPIYDDRPNSPNFIALEVIAPSDDYDKYYKSTYQQLVMGGDAGIPIFNVNVRAHSNVENGLGIFAGYSSYTSDKVEVVRRRGGTI